MLTLHIEVRSDDEVGPVQYLTWELPLRVRGREPFADARLSELVTPIGLELVVAARWWPGAGGDLSVVVSGHHRPLAEVSPLSDGTWLALLLPTGEELSIRARG